MYELALTRLLYLMFYIIYLWRSKTKMNFFNKVQYINLYCYLYQSTVIICISSLLVKWCVNFLSVAWFISSVDLAGNHVWVYFSPRNQLGCLGTMCQNMIGPRSFLIFKKYFNLPYRTKLCWATVANYFESDENFARWVLLPDENFARQSFAQQDNQNCLNDLFPSWVHLHFI